MGKAKYTTHLITRELYNKWIEKTGRKESFERFVKIWEMIAETLQDEVISNTDGVRLGFYTGDIRLNYTKKYDPIINEKASDEVGKDVKHTNWNTNGKLGKVIWSIDYARKRNKRIKLYAFEPDRVLSRQKAANAFKNTPEIYKDNNLSKFQIKVIKDKNNPWLHGMDILKRKPIESTNTNKRSYLEHQEGTEGD